MTKVVCVRIPNEVQPDIRRIYTWESIFATNPARDSVRSDHCLACCHHSSLADIPKNTSFSFVMHIDKKLSVHNCIL